MGQLCELFHNIVKFPLLCAIFCAQTERDLDASRAAEADGHLIAVHDHGDRTTSVGVREHASKRRGVLLDVEILERDMPPLKVVTGGLRVGSGVFAEDEDHEALSHQPRFSLQPHRLCTRCTSGAHPLRTWHPSGAHLRCTWHLRIDRKLQPSNNPKLH
jgi:hypothetical protein